MRILPHGGVSVKLDRPSLVSAPDSTGKALCSLLGAKTEAPALTGWGLSVRTSLVLESWNQVARWLTEASHLL